MRNRISIIDNDCNYIQNELDKIEKKVLIKLFGKETIPNKTAMLLSFLGINPNEYIKKFESTLKPIMKSNGAIDGPLLKNLISFTKFKEIINIVEIPNTDFFLSDYMESLINDFFREK